MHRKHDPQATSAAGRDLVKSAIIIKGIALLVVGAAAGAAGFGVANVFGFNPFQSTQADRSQPALLLSIQEISEYHAAVGNFELVVDVEDDASWVPNIIAGRRTLFVAAGTVDAYLDLSGLAAGDLTLSEDGKTATVRLPEAQLDKPNLDPERSSVVMQDRGVLDRIADALDTPQQAEFYALAETKMTAAAEESDLRNQAEENTEAMLTGMFGSLGISATFLDAASR